LDEFSLEEPNVDLSFYETVYTSSKLANGKSIAEGGEKTVYNAPCGLGLQIPTSRPPGRNRSAGILPMLHNL
jgi:hypothetical protein